MARRGHGDGSIYQRKDGRWTASISLGGRKRKYIYGKTKAEVQKQLKVALYEQQQGILASGSQQTLKTYLEQWFEEVQKPTLRVSSYAKSSLLLHKHILPQLGHIQLQKLSPQQIQAFYTSKMKDGLSSSMIAGMHGLLHKALENAVRWGLVPRNACDRVSLPRKQRREIQPLTKEQAVRLLEAAKGHRLEGLLAVALATGMRRGELLALRWQDLDFENRSLHIRRTVSYIEGNGFVENEPKTAKSRRTVLLPQFVIDALKAHRTRQEEIRQKVGDEWKNNDIVFCNVQGGFIAPSILLRLFYKLLAEAGLPRIHFHDLRHSAATILLTMGAHPKVIQELLGHSQISMTMDTYSHVLPSMQRDMMDGLDDLFSR